MLYYPLHATHAFAMPCTALQSVLMYNGRTNGIVDFLQFIYELIESRRLGSLYLHTHQCPDCAFKCLQ